MPVIALQHDYKKACELADQNSHEVTDLLDQLSKKEQEIEKLRHRINLQDQSLKEMSETHK